MNLKQVTQRFFSTKYLNVLVVTPEEQAQAQQEPPVEFPDEFGEVVDYCLHQNEVHQRSVKVIDKEGYETEVLLWPNNHPKPA